MYVKEVLVQNKAGLHARPATFFIQKANEYKSTIWVEKEERRVGPRAVRGRARCIHSCTRTEKRRAGEKRPCDPPLYSKKDDTRSS